MPQLAGVRKGPRGDQASDSGQHSTALEATGVKW
jgi:hypothetical protein